MTLATLRDVLQPALTGGYAVAGLVCLGWEDMRAYVAAAEAEGAPVILQAGPGCRAHTPLPVLAGMLRHLGDGAGVAGWHGLRRLESAKKRPAGRCPPQTLLNAMPDAALPTSTMGMANLLPYSDS